MALRMVSSLRIHAVRAAFLALPAASSLWYKSRSTGLCRLPTKKLSAQERAKLQALRESATVAN